jgi:hypothetical protein
MEWNQKVGEIGYQVNEIEHQLKGAKEPDSHMIEFLKGIRSRHQDVHDHQFP